MVWLPRQSIAYFMFKITKIPIILIITILINAIMIMKFIIIIIVLIREQFILRFFDQKDKLRKFVTFYKTSL